jgi:hypothetical protein
MPGSITSNTINVRALLSGHVQSGQAVGRGVDFIALADEIIFQGLQQGWFIFHD